MRALASVIVCSLLVLPPLAVEAKSKPKAESPEKRAKKACAAGDFRTGVEILADLYVQHDDPTFVYNQGRCYEQNHQLVNAIDRFREYLRKASRLTPEETAEVEKHIADCKRLLDEETAATSPPPQPPPPPTSPPEPAASPPPEVVVAPAAPPAGRPGAALRTTGIVVGAVGLATLGAALALNLKANSLADKANKSFDPDAESSQKSYKTGALVCYGVGGAALVAGATLYLIGRSKGAATSQGLALVPMWSPGEAGLALSGEF